jgi:hypothetical protein
LTPRRTSASPAGELGRRAGYSLEPEPARHFGQFRHQLLHRLGRRIRLKVNGVHEQAGAVAVGLEVDAADELFVQQERQYVVAILPLLGRLPG